MLSRVEEARQIGVYARQRHGRTQCYHKRSQLLLQILSLLSLANLFEHISPSDLFVWSFKIVLKCYLLQYSKGVCISTIQQSNFGSSADFHL